MNKQFISAVHQLDCLSIHHEIEMRPTEARAFSLHANAHPQPADELRAMLKQIDAAMPRMFFGMLNGAPNQNNGRMFHKYRIGKAYSRVVFVDAAKLNVKTPFDWNRLAAHICAIGKAYNADECDIIENDQYSFSVRLWWD